MDERSSHEVLGVDARTGRPVPRIAVADLELSVRTELDEAFDDLLFIGTELGRDGDRLLELLLVPASVVNALNHLESPLLILARTNRPNRVPTLVLGSSPIGPDALVAAIIWHLKPGSRLFRVDRNRWAEDQAELFDQRVGGRVRGGRLRG